MPFCLAKSSPELIIFIVDDLLDGEETIAASVGHKGSTSISRAWGLNHCLSVTILSNRGLDGSELQVTQRLCFGLERCWRAEVADLIEQVRDCISSDNDEFEQPRIYRAVG